MNLELLAYPAVFLLGAAALSILIMDDWRVIVAGLVIQYIGVFALTAMSWPVQLAAVKFVAGFMAAIVLGMARLAVLRAVNKDVEQNMGEPQTGLSRALFRLLGAGMVLVTVASLAETGTRWVPGIQVQQIVGGTILVGLGLLRLGYTANPFRLFAALLTVLAGYEIVYASVESSLLVAGLLAGVNLGLALVGAYLITLPGESESI